MYKLKASEYTLIPYILFKYYGIDNFNRDDAEIINKNPKNDFIQAFLKDIKYYNRGQKKGKPKGISGLFTAGKINMNYVFPFNDEDGKIYITDIYKSIFLDISCAIYEGNDIFFIFENKESIINFKKLLKLKTINSKLLDGDISFKNKAINFLKNNNVIIEEKLFGDNKTTVTGTRSVATKNYLLIGENKFQEKEYSSINNDRMYIRLEDIYTKHMTPSENLEKNIINKINNNGVVKVLYKKFPEKYYEFLEEYFSKIKKHIS